MYYIRSVQEDDLEELYELSKLMVFINLPQDKKLIKEKIDASIKAFKNPSKNLYNNYYLFVLVNSKSDQIIGASMIHAQHGTEEEPHFYLKVGQEHKFSQTINTGFVHGTLKLGLETNGPTEIGGLILHPDFRGSEEKLGKQLAFSRFLYMAKKPNRFKEYVHSELMPPLDAKGNSPLWEAIGRKFMNMDYNSADILSRNNKEFILSLYPSDTIYVTLLPIQARNAIGKVGSDTKPIKKMLESIGFKYMNEVDPFDGGPHYRCKLSDIYPIKHKVEKVAEIVSKEDADFKNALIETNTEHDFSCVKVRAKEENNLLKVLKDDKINLDSISKDKKSTLIWI